MFIVLKTEDPAVGFIKRRRQKKALDRSEPVSHPTENGLPFFTLNISKSRGGASLRLTEEKCGRYVSRIVAPRDLLLPDNGKIRRFTSGAANGIFIFNTAVESMNGAKLRPDELCITVIDRTAHMSGEISRLLPFAASVRVVTSRPERYSDACNRIYNDCGASVMIRPVYQPVTKKEIIICCDGATTAEMRNSAVFSFRQNCHGELRFFSDEIALSENHRKIIPQNIDTVDFAGAVTELCAGTEYRFSPFIRTETSCRKCAGAAAADCLGCYALGKSINA